MTNYTQQAEDFATKTQTTMTAVYLGHFARFGDHVTAVFQITLARPGRKSYTFKYSDSLQDSWQYVDHNAPGHGIKKTQGLPPKLGQKNWPKTSQEYKAGQYTLYPTHKTPIMYDVLACVQKYDVGSFENFCADFGYDEDSRKALATYVDVQKEWAGINGLVSDVLDDLQEIN